MAIESCGESPGACLGGARDARSPLRGLGASPRPTPPLQRREGSGAVPGSTPRDRRPPDHPYEVLGRSSVGLEVRATRLDALGPRFESRVASLDASCPPPPYIGEPRPPTSLHHHYKGDAVPQRLTPPSTKGGNPYRGSLTTNTKGEKVFSPLGRLPWGLIRSPGRPPAYFATAETMESSSPSQNVANTVIF